MPSISTCPKCAKPVTVPDGLAESSDVRCPLCDAQYPAHEVTELKVDTDDRGNLPPQLIPIDPQAAHRETGLPVKCPCCDAQFGMAELIVAATGKELGIQAASAVGPGGSVASTDEKPAGLPSFGPSREDHAPHEITIDTGIEPTPVKSAAFDFRDQEADRRDGALAGVAATAGVRRRRDSEKHPVRFLVEIVLGGVAGLVITYYGLNFFGGQRFDWFEVYLPGVSHTVANRPAWWPSISRQPDSGQTGTDPTTTPIRTPAEPSVTGLDGFVGALPPVEADPEEPPVKAPAPAEEPADEPGEEPPPPPPVGPTDPPSFTSDELGQVLKTTHGAFTADGLTDETYHLLCQLGQTVTFVELAGGGPKLRNRLEAVDILLRRMAGDPLNLIKIGEMANNLAHDPERTHDGILLAGTLESTLDLGETHGAAVQPLEIDSPLVVVSKTPITAKLGDRILVLGSLVDEPAENMVGVDTSVRRVIWSRMTVNLDK